MPRPDRGDRVGGVIEVVEVLVRDHRQRAQPLAAEQAALLEALQARVVVEQAVEQRRAAGVADAAQPAQVVEAEVVEPQFAGSRSSAAATRRHRPEGESQMPTARSPSTCWTASVTIPAGLVKLISQAFGRVLGDRLRQPHHHRDRAQREADAARPGRLLAEHAHPERDVLVDDAALELADADRAEHEVRALDGVHEVGRRAERELGAVLGREPVEHARRSAPAAPRRCRAARSRRARAARPSPAAPRRRAGRGTLPHRRS